MKCSFCFSEIKTYKKKQQFCSMKCFGLSKLTLITKVCICGKEFSIAKLKLSKGRGKFCSKKCVYENMSRPSGLKYTIHKQNPTSFKKGNKTWNVGLIKKNFTGKSYDGLHDWVERMLGKPKECSNCGTKTAKVYQWSNKSGQYKIDLSDWQRLCVKCHCLYDYQNFGARKAFYK